MIIVNNFIINLNNIIYIEYNRENCELKFQYSHLDMDYEIVEDVNSNDYVRILNYIREHYEDFKYKY